MTDTEADLALAEHFLRDIEANLARWKAILIFLECDGHTGHEGELASDAIAMLHEGWTLASTLLAHERTTTCDAETVARHRGTP